MSTVSNKAGWLLATLLTMSGCQSNEAKARLPAVSASPVPPAAATAARQNSTETPTPEPPPTPENADSPSQPQQSDRSPFFTGTTEPYRRGVLMPRVGGPIVRVDVKEGDLIKSGATVIVQDASSYRLGLRQAEAGRKLALAQIDAVRIEWRRLRGLVKAKAVPRGQFEKVDAQLKVAMAGLEQADAGIAQAKKMVRDTIVRAPFGGVVTKVMVEVGQWVATMPPTTLAMIEQIDKLKLRVQVPETALRQVKVGTPLKVNFTAINKAIEAKVSKVVRSINPQTRTFSVLVELDNSNDDLQPGMFAEVKLQSGKEK